MSSKRTREERLAKKRADQKEYLASKRREKERIEKLQLQLAEERRLQRERQKEENIRRQQEIEDRKQQERQVKEARKEAIQAQLQIKEQLKAENLEKERQRKEKAQQLKLERQKQKSEKLAEELIKEESLIKPKKPKQSTKKRRKVQERIVAQPPTKRDEAIQQAFASRFLALNDAINVTPAGTVTIRPPNNSLEPQDVATYITRFIREVDITPEQRQLMTSNKNPSQREPLFNIVIHYDFEGYNTNKDDPNPQYKLTVHNKFRLSYNELSNPSLYNTTIDAMIQAFARQIIDHANALYNKLNNPEKYAVAELEFTGISKIDIWSNIPATNNDQLLNALKAFGKSVKSDSKYQNISVHILPKMCIYESFFLARLVDKISKKNGDEHDARSFAKGNIQWKKDLLQQFFEEEDDITKEYIIQGNLVQAMRSLCMQHNTDINIYRQECGKLLDVIRIDNLGNMQVDTISAEKEPEGFNILYVSVSKHVSVIDIHNHLKKKESQMKASEKPRVQDGFYSMSNASLPKGKKVVVCTLDTETIQIGKTEQVSVLVFVIGSEKKTITFTGKNSVSSFVTYLKDNLYEDNETSTNRGKGSKKPKYLIYAHNGNKFDYILLQREMHSQGLKIEAKSKSAGAIIMYKSCNIKFMDSYKLITNSLERSVEVFLPNKNMAKTPFPYNMRSGKFINEDGEYSYIGRVPKVKYWKSKKDRDTFIKLNPHFATTKEQLEAGTHKPFNLRDIAIDYCINDTIILHELITTFREEYMKGEINDTPYDVRSCMTSASMALKIYQQVMPRTITINNVEVPLIFEEPHSKKGSLSGLDLESSEYFKNRTRNSYYGGISGVNRYFFKRQKCDHPHYPHQLSKCDKGAFCTLHIAEKGLYYYDINSSYPAAMTKDIPFMLVAFDRSIKTYKSSTKINIKDVEIKDTTLYLTKCKYQTDDDTTKMVPNLPVRDKSGGLSYITDQTDEYRDRWGVEIKQAIKQGLTFLEIKDPMHFASGKVFADFINHFYGERQKIKVQIKELKKQGNQESQIKILEARSEFYKLILNSLYGKFGQKDAQYSKYMSHTELARERCSSFEDIESITYMDDLDLFWVTMRDPNQHLTNPGSLVFVASYITALARTNLTNFMQTVGFDNVMYYDTDSVFFLHDGNPKEDKSIKHLLSDTELGKWKDELGTSVEEFYSIGTKMYAYKYKHPTKIGYEYKVTMKGIYHSKLDRGTTDDEYYEFERQQEILDTNASEPSFAHVRDLYRQMHDISSTPENRYEDYNTLEIDDPSLSFPMPISFKINRDTMEIEYETDLRRKITPIVHNRVAQPYFNQSFPLSKPKDEE